jgi:hypothetical protein
VSGTVGRPEPRGPLRFLLFALILTGAYLVHFTSVGPQVSEFLLTKLTRGHGHPR